MNSVEKRVWWNLEELEQMDASELHARRLNAKEVFTFMKNETHIKTPEIFVFPVAGGTVKTAGGDRCLRPSTFIRDRPERGGEQGILQGQASQDFF